MKSIIVILNRFFIKLVFNRVLFPLLGQKFQQIYKLIDDGAQFYVVRPSEGEILKFEKTQDETREWLAQRNAKQWIDTNQQGKLTGFEIYNRKLKGSGIVLDTKNVGRKNLFVQTKGGKIKYLKNRNTYFQIEVEVLSDALQRLYQKDNQAEIERILEQIINKTQRMWKFGVFERAFAITNNWGLFYKNGETNVRLFDFWDITEDREEALKHSERDFTKMWEIMDKEHPKSLINLTNFEIANWFLGKLREEYNPSKLRELWESESSFVKNDF